MNVFKQATVFVRANLWILPLAAVVIWILFRFLDPAPPRTVGMMTGIESGGYHQFGLKLKERLASEGLTLELYPSRGSVDNLHRLTDGSGEVQLGLIQSGTTSLLERQQLRRLRGLAALYHEPLWLFQRGDTDIRRLTDLYDLRVSVGTEGSGTWSVVRSLFGQVGNQRALELLETGTWQASGSNASVRGLLEGELDAAFLVLPVGNNLLNALISEPEVRLVNLAQTEALASRLSFLEHIVLPEGLLDLSGNVPPEDSALLSPVATLVATDAFHPALTSLVLEASREVLREGNLLDAPNAFPAAVPMELELTGEAEYYHREGVPFLQRYLPFWIASIADRYVVLLIPFIVIMLPLLRSMGPIYTWRMRARVFKWYEHLRRVDRLIINGQIKGVIDREIAGLHDLEGDLSRVEVPLSYAHELYSLHLHVRYMISRLEAMRAPPDQQDAAHS
ncbi:MAG: TAXI family TRAP transporter solute-binding subunit [Pseudomonas profundi]|uniref:TAXI family TRAP transporter solute-binding subunit n=1 Tax=Pseudomonas profundi TaxID=1981513 RepID=UPI003002F2A6